MSKMHYSKSSCFAIQFIYCEENNQYYQLSVYEDFKSFDNHDIKMQRLCKGKNSPSILRTTTSWSLRPSFEEEELG